MLPCRFIGRFQHRCVERAIVAHGQVDMNTSSGDVIEQLIIDARPLGGQCRKVLDPVDSRSQSVANA
jgi:hypothetical protein